MTGGQISGLVTLQDNSVSTWDGGQIDNKIQLFGNAKLYWNGALLTSGSNSNSAMDPAGLLPADGDDDSSPISIYLYDNSSLTIGGQNLSAELIDGNSDGGFSEYSLSGILGDGVSLPSNLQLYVENGATASFNFVTEVPEPTASMLIPLAIGCLFWQPRHLSRLARSPRIESFFDQGGFDAQIMATMPAAGSVHHALITSRCSVPRHRMQMS